MCKLCSGNGWVVKQRYEPMYKMRINYAERCPNKCRCDQKWKPQDSPLFEQKEAEANEPTRGERTNQGLSA
jgi:hypothetical protein